MKAKVTNISVTDDLYLYIDVDTDGRFGYFSYNIVWEDISEVCGITQETTCELQEFVEGRLLEFMREAVKKAAQEIRDELTCFDIDLEV